MIYEKHVSFFAGLPSLTLIALGLLGGCASESTPPTDEPDSGIDPEACVVQEVLTRNGCMACHDTNAALNGGGLVFTPDRIEESLVGVASKSPGCDEEVLVHVDNPHASVLLHTVAPERYSGALGDACQPYAMPLGGPPTMPPEDVTCLEEWIGTLEPIEEEEPDVTYPAPALTTLTRVKYVLHGSAVTADELALASGPDGALELEGLEDLVASWMSGERFRAKRRQFLSLQLQQTPGDDNYFNQFRNTQPKSMAPIRDALSMSLVRTAERIIQEGEDFRTIITTNEWEVTTLTLLALKMADNPMVLKKNGVWPKNVAINDLKYVTEPEKGLYDRKADSRDWRTVTLVHDPDSTDMMTEEEILDPSTAETLRAIPDGGTVTLRAPRLGFFTSPAFFQTWLTNRDNDFRVTINQAMIVATGRTFSPGDITPLTGDDAAVDPVQFERDSTCYGCHKNLDTMRPAFLAAYDNINTRYTAFDPTLPRPGFSFQGQSVPIDTLYGWAEALADHPNFAQAWVLKLCQWASSIDCAETDPHIQDLTDQFVASGYDMDQLFFAFFTSPLVTQTSDREDSTAPGAQVSVARFDHYCHAMRARLTDVRRIQGLGDGLPEQLDVCSETGPAALLSASLPKDQVVRGAVALHQPKEYTAMVSLAFEGMCALTAEDVVGTKSNVAFDAADPEWMLDLMNEHLLGFPVGTPQYQRAQDMFQRYFDALTASPACAGPDAFQVALGTIEPECGLELSDVDALRDLWTLACHSPSLTGVGP